MIDKNQSQYLYVDLTLYLGPYEHKGTLYGRNITPSEQNLLKHIHHTSKRIRNTIYNLHLIVQPLFHIKTLIKTDIANSSGL